MYRMSVAAMTTAQTAISAFAAATGIWGTRMRTNMTTNSSAVHTYPNHMAPSSFLPSLSFTRPITAMKPSLTTKSITRTAIYG